VERSPRADMIGTHHGWRHFLADTVVYGVIFGLTNVVSYLFIVLVGRTLAAHEFGVFTALVGAIVIAGFFAGPLQLAVTQAAALLPSLSGLKRLTRTTVRSAFACIVLLTLAAIPYASRIGAKELDVALCGVATLLVYVGCAPMGFLGGIGKVRAQAHINLLGTIMRLCVGWPLMVFGLGVTGALFGYVWNYAVVFVLADRLSRRIAFDRSSAVAQDLPHLRIQGSAIATFALTFIPFSLDQLLVQAFAPSLGGDYAALTTMAKIVFFGAFPVLMVAYPRLLVRTGAGRRTRLFAAAAGLVICCAGSLAWLLVVLPGQSMAMVFAEGFPEVTPFVGRMAIAVGCFSVAALCAYALTAWGSRIAFVPFLVAMVTQIGLFASRHDSLGALVSNQVWTYGLQLVLVTPLLVFTIHRSVKRERRLAYAATQLPT